VQTIFDVPALNKKNHVALRELLNTILKHLRAFKAIKRPIESWDDLIVHIGLTRKFFHFFSLKLYIQYFRQK